MEEDKFCKYCGKKIPKACIVCPKCGRQLEILKEKNDNIEVNEEKSNNKGKGNSGKVVRYVLGALIIFASLARPNFISGLLTFVCGVTIFPIFYELIVRKYVKEEKTIKLIQIIMPIGLFVLATIFATSAQSKSNDYMHYDLESSQKEELKEIDMIDFSSMTKDSIIEWCNINHIVCYIKDEYSNNVENGKFVSQSVEKETKIKEKSKVEIVFSLGKEPTKEQKNALKKAESYARVLNMSKQAIYDQLISEYGEGFTKEDAKYAIDHLEWDWNANALEKAKSYRETLNMSKKKIYDQLISKYGEKFTKSEAQYAIDHLDD